MIERYVGALCAQISREAPAYSDFLAATIFFGGGTPSLLSVDQMDRIMGTLYGSFEVDPQAEITMESNPGTLTEGKLEGFRRAGINRLSIGLQSANDERLRALGRIHTYGDFLEDFYAARRAGFSNINVDLMSALPGQTPSDWKDTLVKVAQLSPEHISAYSLIIEEGTPFYERYGEEAASDAVRQGKAFCEGTDKTGGAPYPALPSEEEERLMYEQTLQVLEEFGYHRYEISNYAKPGRDCRHNIGYWKRTDYVGFGLGASSLVNNVRWTMTDCPEEYLRIFSAPPVACGAGKTADGEAIEGSAPGREEIQVLSRTEQMEEFLFLGLRLTEGIRLGDFRTRFGIGLLEVYRETLEKLEADGLLLFYEDGKRMKLTPRGVDVSNYVLAQFLLEE